MRKSRAVAAACAAILVSALAVGPADAAVVTVTASGIGTPPPAGTGTLLSAKAVFDNLINPGFLTITLTNTSTEGVKANNDLLTAIFFTLDASFTPGSAVLGPSSSLVNAGSCDPTGGGATATCSPLVGGVVGGEFQYGQGLTNAPGGATMGITSAGFTLSGASLTKFPGGNLDGPQGVDGPQFGIISNAGFAADANVVKDEVVIKNSVVFKLAGEIEDAVLLALSNVSFQYGTALNDPDEPNLPVPLPAAAWLLLSGLGGLGLIGRRRKAA